jgi:transcriptional regulator with XRE-family HTH domain
MSRSVHSDSYAALTRALIALRRKGGLRQLDVAKRLGKPQSFVSKVERGERKLDLVELLILARAIEADANEIVALVAHALPAEARI